MVKLPLFFWFHYSATCLITVFLFSCNEEMRPARTRENLRTAVSPDVLPLTKADSIIFDFTVAKKREIPGIYEISGRLFNAAADTSFFLTYSCPDNHMYLLHYDTALFTMNPPIFCGVSYPVVGSIAPRTYFSFTAHMKPRTIEKKIGLGFYYFQVDPQVKAEIVKAAALYSIKNKELYLLPAQQKTFD